MSDSLQPVDCKIPDFPLLNHLTNLLKLMSTESVMPSKFSTILGLYPLMPVATPSLTSCDSKKMSPDVAKCPLETVPVWVTAVYQQNLLTLS